MRRLLPAGILGVLAAGLTATGAGAGVDDSRPDARISLQAPQVVPEIGNNVYEDSSPQTIPFGIDPGETARAKVRFQNDAGVPDTLRVGAVVFVRGPGLRPLGALEIGDDCEVRFRRNGKDVTRKVSANKLKFRNVAPGKTVGPLRVVIALAADAQDVAPLVLVVHVTSANDRTEQDLVTLQHALK